MTIQEFVKLRGLYNERDCDGDCGDEYENQSYYKEEFRKVGREFLGKVSKDIGFDEVDIHYNPAGIACSGDHTLIGMKEGKGLYISFNTDGMKEILYRTVTHMKDWTGGYNYYVSLTADYKEMSELFKDCLGIN